MNTKRKMRNITKKCLAGTIAITLLLSPNTNSYSTTKYSYDKCKTISKRR